MIYQYQKAKLKFQPTLDTAEDDELAKKIDQEKKDEAEASTKFAEDSPYAPREEIQTDVYWEVDNDADNKLKGTYFFND